MSEFYKEVLLIMSLSPATHLKRFCGALPGVPTDRHGPLPVLVSPYNLQHFSVEEVL